MTYKIIPGDNKISLKTIASNSIDAIVTDPPYGIDFLGKAWDANTGDAETYQECLRVLKPGGYIVAFSAARTYHHLAMTLERVGFDIKDQIMWIYSSGFPKSQDVGKNNKMPEWSGWGTSLKPAHEPICLAQKPTKLSINKNAQKYGTGALNIDATRVPFEDQADIDTYLDNKRGPMERANIEDGKNIGMFDGGVGYRAIKRKVDPVLDLPAGRFPSNVIGEIPDYQKYFYCPKVSRRERHMGWDLTKVKTGNNHPTVKPVALMEYLIKLITPPGGTVLDPYNGSGSTGMAAVGLGYNYIGLELDERYCEISQRRIDAWTASDTNFDDLFEEE